MKKIETRITLMIVCIFLVLGNIGSVFVSQAADASLDQRLRALIMRHLLTGDAAAGRDIAKPSDPLPKLGKFLFFTKDLSTPGTVACVSCHHPLFAGGDKLSLPVGVDAVDPDILGPGRVAKTDSPHDLKADGLPNVPRNSQTVFNAALYLQNLFHDGRVFILEQTDDGRKAIASPANQLRQPSFEKSLLAAQAKLPVTSAAEMLGFEGDSKSHHEVWYDLEQKLRAKEHWLPLFRTAFDQPEGSAEELITIDNMAHALAAFQDTMIFTDNPWSRYIKGDTTAISEDAARGAEIFYEERTNGGAACVFCHSGDFFTDEKFYPLAIPQFGRGKSIQETDPGRFPITRNNNERYAFRTPTLLNVAKTGPYGHTGAYETLKEIVDHHVDPRKAVDSYDYSLKQLKQFENLDADYPYAQRNSQLAYQFVLRLITNTSHVREEFHKMGRLGISDEDVDHLVAFLETLTDPCLEDPQCLAPWFIFEESAAELKPFNLLEPKLPSLTQETILDIEPEAGEATESGLSFTDITEEAGLTHTRYQVVEGDNRWLMVDDSPAVNQNALAVANMLVNMGGIAAGDIDRDGRTDLVFERAGKDGSPVIYRGLEGGKFEDATAKFNLQNAAELVTPLLVDLNGDGYLDLFGGRIGAGKPHYRLNENGEGFAAQDTDLGITSKRNIFSAGFGDVDNDHDLDLFLTHWSVSQGATEPHLWRNLGDLKFEAAAKDYNIVGDFGELDMTFTPIFADMNKDGFQDLLVVSDTSTTQYFLSKEGKILENATDPSVINDESGMGTAVGDYDNDGDLDWFVSSINGIGYKGGATWTGNRLYQNDGTGVLSNVTEYAGIAESSWAWGTCFADFDNDADLDLLVVNGYADFDHAAEQAMDPISNIEMPEMNGMKFDVPIDTLKQSLASFINTPTTLFLNTGNGRFVESAEDVGIIHNKESRGIVCHDFDQDGDVDIVIANTREPATYYRNDLTDSTYLSVELVGNLPNREGFGAWIEVEAGGITQTRQVVFENNYASQNPPTQHFGLGNADKIDRVKVTWPITGQVTEKLDVEINSRLIINQTE